MTALFATSSLLLVVLATTTTNVLQVDAIFPFWSKTQNREDCIGFGCNWVNGMSNLACSSVEELYSFLEEIRNVDTSAVGVGENADKFLQLHIRDAIFRVFDWIYDMRTSIGSTIAGVASSFLYGKNELLVTIADVFTIIPRWWFKCSL